MSKAKRYNKGKLRYELIPQEFLDELAKVYTLGAHKYTIYEDAKGVQHKGANISLEDSASMTIVDDGADNWRLGQNWMGSMASVKRHISSWVKGEDVDPDLGTLHLGNAAWGLASLITYYKIYPQGDDRKHEYLRDFKIGLDIDEVLCDWVGPWTNLHGLDPDPKYWYFDYKTRDHFDRMTDQDTLTEFYLSLPKKVDYTLPFEPHCYITSRPVDTDVTKQWLFDSGFPTKPVHTVGVGRSKVDIALELELDIFVDDSYHNFIDLNRAGVCCYLMDAPHNQQYDVGHKRIKHLNDIL
jgi:hypothetical protein